jgi:MscS family membrane protein
MVGRHDLAIRRVDWTLVGLAVFILAGSVVFSLAQLPTSSAPPPVKAEPTIPVDPLGREAPRHAMMSFLKYVEREDYETAASYLQPTPGQNTDLAERAKELRALLRGFKGNPSLLSDDANGWAEPGLPPGHVRVGMLAVGGMTADVILVRVIDPSSGKIWLISKETVASIPKLTPRWKAKSRHWPIE